MPHLPEVKNPGSIRSSKDPQDNSCSMGKCIEAECLPELNHFYTNAPNNMISLLIVYQLVDKTGGGFQVGPLPSLPLHGMLRDMGSSLLGR